ncbi:MAG: hypothetical protein HPY90_09820 [Syntrophothermus sp.]|uniref:uroporphyrinogen decarboxylase family protein n=1 Tax=Syntrophothermus sp. TaxID=2736299 RepID=UPI00257B8AF6|nr:uroporphyrinogen decarboxylase family protein [Syntrophothermus sp.]NSW83551.1 hypothetical protein [Syntrophothermus sp.]
MNHRKRVLASIRHQALDRIPLGELVIPDGLVERAFGVKPRGDRARLCLRKEFLDELGMDLVVVDASRQMTGDSIGSKSCAVSEVEFWARESDFFVFVLFEGGFTRALNLFGWQDFFRVLAKSPGDVVSVIGETCQSLEGTALEMLQAGADGIIIGDDIAYRKGLFVSPELLREVLWGPLARMIERIKVRVGAPVFFHSEGNIWQALPDIVGAGFDGVHSLEPSSGMDLGEVRRVFGETLCLMGNLEVQYLLCHEESDLVREVTGILEVVGNGAGFIFSTTGGLIDEVDLVKLKRMCELVTSWRPSW